MTEPGATPRWAYAAKDLTNALVEASRLLTKGQVANLTGLSPATLTDALSRDSDPDGGSPRSILARPHGRVARVPLWSHDQVNRYLSEMEKARIEQGTPFPVKRYGGMEVVPYDEAAKRQLVSADEVARILGVHPQSVRRWQTQGGGYPVAVANRARDGLPGAPEVVRPWPEIRKWLKANYPDVGAPKRIDIQRLPAPASMAALDEVTATQVIDQELTDLQSGLSQLKFPRPSSLRRNRKLRESLPSPVGKFYYADFRAWREVYSMDDLREWVNSRTRSAA